MRARDLSQSRDVERHSHGIPKSEVVRLLLSSPRQLTITVILPANLSTPSDSPYGPPLILNRHLHPLICRNACEFAAFFPAASH